MSFNRWYKAPDGFGAEKEEKERRRKEIYRIYLGDLSRETLNN